MKRQAVLLACALYGLASIAQINTARMLDMGRNAVYFEDYIVAIQYFNQVIKAKPYLAEPFFWRGYAKLCLDDYQGAIRDCDAALDINPFLPKAYYCRAFAERRQGQLEASTRDLRASLRFEPGNINTTQTLIDNLARMERYDEALRVCDSFLLAYPLYTDIHLQRSRLMLARRDTLAALQDLDTVLRSSPGNDMAYAMRAMTRFEMKRYREALSDMNQAVRRSPYRADYFGNRAIIRMRVNDLRGAMQDFDHAVELDNKNAVTYFNRALLRMQVGDDNRAADDLSTCLALEPANYTARLQRAMLLARLGDYATALADYDQIIARYPDFTPAYYGRGEIKRTLRDKAGAERDFYDARVIEEEVKSGKRAERQGEETREPLSAEAQAILLRLDRKDSDRYKSEIRGQVQYKEVLIDPIGPFVIGQPDSSDGLFRRRLSDRTLDSLNRVAGASWTFCIHERPADARTLEDAFRQMESLAARLEADSTLEAERWQRALLRGVTGDWQGAVTDLDYLARHAERPGLYYFALGNARMKESAYQHPDGDLPADDPLTAAGDYRAALRHLPGFAYVHYNLGCAQLAAKRFGEAIESFGRAIGLYGECAEAYYNRGLIYLYQGNKEAGRDDLSRAGELGLPGAYNIIRRYGY